MESKVTDDECRYLASLYPNRTGLLETYDNYPLNVMRADVCRVLVVYFYGGIYMDLDVKWVRPIDEWFLFNASSRIQYGWENETNHFYCNWFFGATRGHVCLASVLDLIAQRGRGEGDGPMVDPKDEHYVHQMTGPAVFFTGIDRCGTRTRPSFTLNEMVKINIKHVYGSINPKWGEEGYESWRVAQNVMNAKRTRDEHMKKAMIMFQKEEEMKLKRTAERNSMKK
mmetsp:Transcript_35708/g.78166  ORF Transcript_35708/g.78166 Transcript_35708/m.78166 type:complete len:226 (-) Transcript_35708:2939-3616(-)|eukprot:CAMPEP_0178685560 /NCGR_PEP_ID=MMETSP0699-20121125/3451_1 /TAXON_ID=265572 /ORGANISM="Extubocellulus spinifer, Strain CCMP396" /LENGTH=225 /DNA_ID=CAMNT_0020330327 /DNA_START=379 /DNA_END=1056 /DNA_ORIENTATION=-